MVRSADNVIECPGALVVGAGVAGLFTALKLAPFPALIVSAARPGTTGSSVWAQGGIAAAIGPDDSWVSHAADTIAAGAGTGERSVAEFVAREGPDRIDDLIRFGTGFDRAPDGALALAREAAHSHPRIVHTSGDRAGVEVTRALAQAVAATPSISVFEGFYALELATFEGRVVGLFARQGAESRLTLFRAQAIVLATGGVGALFAVTTNPPESRGEGLGMAARAGAAIADPEFVQFHPTAIDIGRDPAPLATEALRGEGAILVDEHGRRFMQAVHPAGELAPRDVVARTIHREIAQGHHIFLDCREAIGARFAERFPTVQAACLSGGIDPSNRPIPLAPAAHYHMGGIASDDRGRSSLPGLWCVGECASTGLHGANRLASNSLVEALVFGARIADNIRGGIRPARANGKTPGPARFEPAATPYMLRQAMTRGVGLERDETGLKTALSTISNIERASGSDTSMLNVIAAAKLIAAGALVRRESIGAHFRRDFPLAGEVRQRSLLTLAEADRIVREIPSADSELRSRLP